MKLEETLDKVIKSLPNTIKQAVHAQLQDENVIPPRRIEGDLNQVIEEDKDKQKDDSHAPPRSLPKTGTKKVNKRSSFYLKGGRKPKVHEYTSPLDIAFKVGCNDDMLSTTSILTADDNTEEREKQRAT